MIFVICGGIFVIGYIVGMTVMCSFGCLEHGKKFIALTRDSQEQQP